MELDINEIKLQAEKEFKEELFRDAVERHKQKLREKKTVWDIIFPWKIIIIKKGENNVRRK